MIFLVCDCCGQPAHQVHTTLVQAEHGMMYVFEVGECCIDKPFKVPGAARLVRQVPVPKMLQGGL